MDRHIYDFQIRVLVCPEDGEYVARALEMDLVAYGATEVAAIKELETMVECQISFAFQKRDAAILLFPAEQEYFDRWEQAHKAALKQQVSQDRSMKLKARAVAITFTKQELQRLKGRRTFRPVAAPARA